MQSTQAKLGGYVCDSMCSLICVGDQKINVFEAIVLLNKEANGLIEINNLANDIEDVVHNMGEVSPSPSAPAFMSRPTTSLELW